MVSGISDIWDGNTKLLLWGKQKVSCPCRSMEYLSTFKGFSVKLHWPVAVLVLRIFAADGFPLWHVTGSVFVGP